MTYTFLKIKEIRGHFLFAIINYLYTSRKPCGLKFQRKRTLVHPSHSLFGHQHFYPCLRMLTTVFYNCKSRGTAEGSEPRTATIASELKKILDDGLHGDAHELRNIRIYWSFPSVNSKQTTAATPGQVYIGACLFNLLGVPFSCAADNEPVSF